MWWDDCLITMAPGNTCDILGSGGTLVSTVTREIPAKHVQYLPKQNRVELAPAMGKGEPVVAVWCSGQCGSGCSCGCYFGTSQLLLHMLLASFRWIFCLSMVKKCPGSDLRNIKEWLKVAKLLIKHALDKQVKSSEAPPLILRDKIMCSRRLGAKGRRHRRN